MLRVESLNCLYQPEHSEQSCKTYKPQDTWVHTNLEEAKEVHKPHRNSKDIKPAQKTLEVRLDAKSHDIEHKLESE